MGKSDSFIALLGLCLVALLAAASTIMPYRLLASLQGEVAMVLAAAIDAGHGGKDPGAVSRTGLYEKQVVLDVARRLAHHLRQAGLDTHLTRSRDQALADSNQADLSARVALANQRRVDVMISIHADSFADPSVLGPRTYHQAGSAEGKRLADAVQRELRALTGNGSTEGKAANFYITRNTTMPAILVEIGFLSNPEEETLLRSPVYRERLASAIARGVRRYLER